MTFTLLQLLHQAIYPDGFEYEVKSFFYNKTHALIKSASVTASTGVSLIDIVRNVVNIVYPSFVAKHWAIPLREDLGGGMGLTVQELYVCLASQFANTFATFGDGAPGIQWQLGEAASKTGNILHSLIKMRVMAMSVPGYSYLNSALGRLSLGKKDADSHGLSMNASSTHFYRTIIKGTKSIEEATNELHGLAVGFCVTQAQQLSQIIEFYLRDEHAEHRARLHELCLKGDHADDEITGYMYEAMRFVGQAPFIPRFVTKDTVIVDGQRNVELKAGDGIFASQHNANMDPSVFEKPELINPRRDRSKYFVFGQGMHQCTGLRFAELSIRSAMRAIFSLPSFRSSPGPAGTFRSMTADHFGNTPVPIYLTDQGFEWPFPVSLQVLYGGEPNQVKRMQKLDTAIVTDSTSQSIVTPSVLNGTHNQFGGDAPLTPPETPDTEKKQRSELEGRGLPTSLSS
jgi:linoleate 10R-lipoxygenase